MSSSQPVVSPSGATAADINAALAGVYSQVAFGTRTYSGSVFYATDGDHIEMSGSFTGAVTGQRFNATMNGVIETYSGNPNYLPARVAGVAGVAATGGQFN
jgi:hypothetical protein